MDKVVHEIDLIKDRLVNKLLILSMINLGFALSISLIRWFEIGFQPTYVFHFLLFIWLIILKIYRKHLSLKLKTHSLGILYLILSIIGLHFFAHYSLHFFVLISISIITILLGRKPAYYYAAFFLALYIFNGWLHVTEKITIQPDLNNYAHLLTVWGSFFVGFLTLFIILIEGFGIFYNELVNSVNLRFFATEDLRKSETFRRQVFESSHLPIVIMDANTYRYIDCNPAAIEIYGYTSKEQILGLTPLDVSAPIQYDEIPSAEKAEFYIEKAKNEGSVVFEWLHQRPDGVVWDAEVHLLSFSADDIPLLQFSLVDITERKKTEESLRKSEEKFKTLFNSGNDAVFIHKFDKNGVPFNFIDVNDVACRRYGYSKEEFLNISPKEMHDTETFIKTGLPVITRVMNGENVTFESIHLTKTGEKIPVEISVNIIDLQGKQVFFSIARDITERKKAEEELRESEEKYKTITETSPVGIWEINQDRKTLYVNPAAISLLELDSTEDLTGKKIDSFFTPESLDVMKAEHSKREQGLQSSYELELVGSRGGRRNVVVSGAPLHSGEGKLTSLIGWFTDITERKLMENKLQIERDNFEIAFESNPIAVLILDEFTRILRANGAAIDLCGGDESQVMHHRLGDAFHCVHSFEAGCDHGSDCPSCPIRRGIENLIAGTGGSIDKAETKLSVIRKKNEQTLWLEVSAAEMLLDTQRAFIVLLDDITERKKTEAEIKLQYGKLEALNERLAKTNKELFDSESRLSKSLNEKEILIREVYHRTKNTMQVIRGMIVLQSLDSPSNFELQQLVKNTEDRIQAISLVHQMLYKSHDLSQISIKEYVQNLITLLVKSYRFSDNRIAFNISVDDHKFLLDTAIPLGLIINELTTNSLKYAFPDGRTGIININLAQVESGNYLLIFTDNGVGVPDGFDFRNCESLGLKLIHSIGEDQMLGKIIIENSNGIRCSLEFPGNLYKARV